MSLPSSMNAVVIKGDKAVLQAQTPLPSLAPGFILIKTITVAGNPTDWKHIDFKLGPQGAISGCDAAGKIVKLGEDVDTSRFHVGDYVYGFVHGSSVRHPTNGAFADYTAMDSNLTYTTSPSIIDSDKTDIPEGPVTSLEGAVSLPVSLTTAGIVLTHEFGLKLEWNPPKPQTNSPILLWGGATGVGQALIQLCKKMNAFSKIIVVCSKKHLERLTAYGADDIFDYHDEDVIQQIRSKYPDIQTLVDCVSNEQTIQQVYQCATDTAPAKVLQLMIFTIDDIKAEYRRDNVELTGTMLYCASGEDVPFGGMTIPANPAYRKATVDFVKFITPKINNGEIHHIPVKVFQNGLKDVPQILDDIKNNRNSGQKLVARL